MGTERAMTVAQAYRVMFPDYPDVVTVPMLQEMLGGVGRRKVYQMLNDERIKHFRIGRRIMIPKMCMIAYLCQLQQPFVSDEHLAFLAATGDP